MTTAAQPADNAQPPTTAEKLGPLQNIITTAQQGDKDATNAAWVAIQQPSVMETFAEVWINDNDAFVGLLAVIETVSGQIMKARTLRAAVKSLAEVRATQVVQQRVNDAEDGLNNLGTLASCFGNNPPPTSIVPRETMELIKVPRGYSIDTAGVYKINVEIDGTVNRRKLVPAPIFIVSRTEDVLTGEAKRQVVWRGPGGWCSRIVDRRTILDTSRIIALSSLEAPVSSNQAAPLVGYLADFEAENSHRLPAIRSSARMGWLPDGGFLLPDGHYDVNKDEEAEGAHALVPPPGYDLLAKGWVPAGDAATWLTCVELVSNSPLMMIALYASCAAPLLRILRIPGFVVDFNGETSSGKTTALRFAASVWGRPAENYPTAMFSWDATKVWIERTAGFLQSLPLILDETKRAKHPGIVRDVIYDFCQGQGRGRGDIHGSRTTDTWRSVLISSGESAATSFSEDAGTRARVLSMRGRPLGGQARKGGAISEELQQILSENYGHLGRQLIAYLVANTESHEAIRAVFIDVKKKYVGLSASAVARRHASHLAALEVAAMIIHTLGVPQPVCDPFGTLVDAMEEAGFDSDRPLIALQDTISWAAINKTRFFGRHDVSHSGNVVSPARGWIGAWGPGEDWTHIAFNSQELRQFLTDAGHHPAEVLDRWHERGWLAPTRSKKNRTKTIRINGVQARCYCIMREAVRRAVDVDDCQDEDMTDA